MHREPSPEKMVVVHPGSSLTEAMVIRGLLESSGIPSPSFLEYDPFPGAEALGESDVIVPESKSAEARRIIADYLKSNEDIEVDNSADSSQGGEKD